MIFIFVQCGRLQEKAAKDLKKSSFLNIKNFDFL
jgi:hypothetical protein